VAAVIQYAPLLLLLTLLTLLAARGEPPAPMAAKFVTAWGKEGEAPGEFSIPVGIAINAADEIFVTDHYNSRVQKLLITLK